MACQGPHSTVTYAVVAADGAVRHYHRPWRAWSSALVSTYTRACQGLGEAPDLVPASALADVVAYLPSARAWAAGARWVRCDIRVDGSAGN